MSLVKRAAVEFDQKEIEAIRNQLAYGVEALQMVAGSVREFREAVGVSQAQVSAATRVLAHRLAAVERNHPEIRLTLDEGSAIVEWMAAVADGTFEVARYLDEAPRARKPKDAEPEPPVMYPVEREDGPELEEVSA